MDQAIPMPIALDEFSKKVKKLSKKGYTHIYTDGPLKGLTGPKARFEVGDMLYVREAWRYMSGFTEKPDRSVMDTIDFVYKADEEWNGPWKPGIHMPKESARIFLQVTDVRAERLHDINEEDAIAEGIEDVTFGEGISYKNYLTAHPCTPVASFKSLWESINTKTSPWDKNDWVWVYTFKKIENPNQ
jgi:hypothetical protein